MRRSTERRVVRGVSALSCLLLSAACTQPEFTVLDPFSRVDPSERAIAIWTAEHGAPAPECADDARSASFETMTADVLAEVCDANLNAVAACVYRYDASGADIALADTEEGTDPTTRLHELLHVLIQCNTGQADGDPHHLDSVWKHVGQEPTL